MRQILLADDNPDLRSALRLLLETRMDLGVIAEARDMENVLAQAEQAHPDCVILDWELPGQPTRERIKLLRSLVPGIKIIVTSALPEAREQALSEGVDAFADKSDSPLNILEIMHRCCEEKE